MKDRLVALAVAACFVPGLAIIGLALAGRLGANPVEAALNDFGFWAVWLLVATLACTPLQKLFGWNFTLRIRKTLGDACFAYATLHLLTYAVFDQNLSLSDIVRDVARHRFILLGMAAWLLLLPLAVTSTRGWQKRLGFRRWKALHRVVYACGALACLHYFMRFKTPRPEAIAAIALIAALYLARLLLVSGKNVARAQHPDRG